MPRKTPTVTVYLRQLSRAELLKLANSKKVRIPEKWSKGKIVETLSTILSPSDVTQIVSQKPKTKTKEAMGYASALKGKSLEDRAAQIFTRQGFQCTKNIRMAGMEIDVVGYKKGSWRTDEAYIIAECKNKAKVTPEDFKKFVGNMNLYISKKGLDKDLVKGYLFTTGVFDKDTKAQARVLRNIQLKRLKP
jgi:Holliday junction resolvase-like predicted endonuclease